MSTLYVSWCDAGPIVKGSSPAPPEQKASAGLESAKKKSTLFSFRIPKIPAFKKNKGEVYLDSICNLLSRREALCVSLQV